MKSNKFNGISFVVNELVISYTSDKSGVLEVCSHLDLGENTICSNQKVTITKQ